MRGGGGVQATNDDAQLSKMSCVKLGYFKDDFVHFFVRRPSRRSPLINRGYYSRFAALRNLMLQFLAAGVPDKHPDAQLKQVQVLSLGAGYDTTFFQLAKEGLAPAKYIEIDFPEVTQQKAAAIQHVPELLACIGGEEAAASISPREGRVITEHYCLLPADLRQLGSLQQALQTAGLDPAAPTYVLSECVLVYMEPQDSSAVVRWLGQHLQTAVFVVYEQIQPDDPFGRQMLLNLEARGCPLLGIHATPSLEAQRRRFTEAGWERAQAQSMDAIYRDCIDPEDRRRIERLELFDELEEWHLIQQHYCIAYGIKDAAGLLGEFGLPQYSQQQQQQQRQLEQRQQSAAGPVGNGNNVAPPRSGSSSTRQPPPLPPTFAAS